KTDTSGEKLYEEFYTDDETYSLSRYQALGVITKTPAYKVSAFSTIIGELQALLNKPDTSKEDIVLWLKKNIPEFDHIETGLGLDKKM
ncbi:MAG: nucleoside-diphosphate sugar epimerase, partial [Chitinophagaceae bacterium]|nr:nucleoside-diphosphate sugar epimerase [Chitinophagaceae bacterium]